MAETVLSRRHGGTFEVKSARYVLSRWLIMLADEGLYESWLSLVGGQLCPWALALAMFDEVTIGGRLSKPLLIEDHLGVK
jgi:hypothetical protein